MSDKLVERDSGSDKEVESRGPVRKRVACKTKQYSLVLHATRSTTPVSTRLDHAQYNIYTFNIIIQSTHETKQTRVSIVSTDHTWLPE